MIIRRIYLNSFLMLCVLFSGWLVWHFSMDFNNAVPPNPHTPDQFGQDVKVIAMRPDGHWDYQFTSPLLEHFTDKDRTAFTTPRVIFYEEKTASWEGTALKGESQEGNSQINLWGDVHLHQSAGPHNSLTDIRTNTAVIYPKKRFVSTLDSLSLHKPEGEISGKGMTLDLVKQSITLWANVHGIYRPPAKPVVNIVSEKALMLKKEGRTIFQGNVRLTQGSSLLICPKLTLYTDRQDQFTEAMANGPGTTYQNISDPKKPPFIITGDEIHYLPLESRVHVVGNAKGTQGENSYRAPDINYFVDKKSIISQKGRMTIVIQPHSLKQQ